MNPLSKPLAVAVLVLMLAGASGVQFPGAGANEGKAGDRGITLIYDIYDLQNMSLDLNGSYALANDIDASDTSGLNGGAGFKSIGNWSDSYWDGNHTIHPHGFGGTLDGRGFAITGLNWGLFGATGKNAIVRDLIMNKSNIASGRGLGSLVGMNDGTISGCSVSGSISGGEGGLVGDNEGDISDCHSSMTVTGRGNSSGLVGMNEGRISNCSFTGTFNSDGGPSGGIVGTNGGTGTNVASISDCYNTGSVTGIDRTGGIVGRSSGPVTRCFNTGNISGGHMTGGIAGDSVIYEISRCFNTGSVTGSNFTGGLIGWNNAYVWESYAVCATLSECVSTGLVNGQSNSGGLAGGDEGLIINCYSLGNVSGTTRVGGLVGQFGPLPDGFGSGLGNITNCYSVGNVTGGADTGGMIGWKSDVAGNVSDCYFDNESAGQVNSAGGTGKPTSEMIKKATFAGWDFDAIWSIDEGISYPSLQYVDLTTTPKDHNPVIKTQPTLTAVAGKEYSVQYSATDPDGDSLSWNMTSNASWLTMSGTGLLAGNASQSDLGTWNITVTVSDGRNGTISQSFGLTVTSNREPEIVSANAPNGTKVPANKVLELSVNASDPDGDPLNYAWKENGVTLSTEKSFSHKFPPGNHTLILLIGDGIYTTTRTFNFTVAPAPTTINTKPAPIPGFEAGIATAAIVTVVTIGLFWRRERR